MPSSLSFLLLFADWPFACKQSDVAVK